MPKWESMILIAIVFTILKDGQGNCNVESSCVLQLFLQIVLIMFLSFSEQIISISTKL